MLPEDQIATLIALTGFQNESEDQIGQEHNPFPLIGGVLVNSVATKVLGSPLFITNELMKDERVSVS